MKARRPERLRRTNGIGALLVLGALTACASELSLPQHGAILIDRYYLEAAKALAQPTQINHAAIRQLTADVDALASAADRGDPCLVQKRQRLLPILLSLAVIDGLAEGEEQQKLRSEARNRLLALSATGADAETGSRCIGRGFPPVTLDGS
jgi:hypothetical protein